MSQILLSLLPVFLLIFTGMALRLTRIVGVTDWRGIENVTYYLFMPGVMITTLYKADLKTVPISQFSGALLAALMTITALMVLARPMLSRVFALEGASFTSAFQGVTRWNTFVALSIAGSGFGNRGLTLVGICIATLTPLLNVMAVSIMARFAHGKPLKGVAFLVNLIKNPMIWSCAVGLALNLLNVPLPQMLIRYGELLTQAGLVVGLLAVGGGLETKTLLRPNAITALCVAVKLIAFPVLATLAGLGLGLSDAADLAVLVICTSVPTAPASYVLAKLNGGDAPLMAEIITVETLAAMITMPLMMWILVG